MEPEVQEVLEQVIWQMMAEKQDKEQIWRDEALPTPMDDLSRWPVDEQGMSTQPGKDHQEHVACGLEGTWEISSRCSVPISRLGGNVQN